MSTVFCIALYKSCDSIDKHMNAVYNFDNRNCMKSLPLSYMRYCNNFVYDINYCQDGVIAIIITPVFILINIKLSFRPSLTIFSTLVTNCIKYLYLSLPCQKF